MKIRQLLLAVCVSVASAQFWDGPDDEKEKKRMEEIKDWSIQDAPPPNLDPSTMDDESCGDCKEGSKIFYYTGTVQKWTAPRCCIVIMSLWGAGGSNSIRAKHGGGGGFARGAVTGHGQDLYITVGEGAHGNSQNDRTDGPFFGGGGKMGLWYHLMRPHFERVTGVDMLEEVVAARRCLWLRSRTVRHVHPQPPTCPQPLTESFLLLEVEAELEHALRLPEALADASRTLGNHSAAGRCATRSITFTERAVTVGGPTTTFGWATPEETWEEGEVAGTRTRISP